MPRCSEAGVAEDLAPEDRRTWHTRRNHRVDVEAFAQCPEEVVAPKICL